MADKTLPPIAIGDSLAVGMREANNLPGIGRVGAGPKEVYEMLQRFATSESLSGRDVFIGTGMPNIPEQKKFIEQQIDFVRKQGGNPILIGVGPGTKSKPTTGQNEFLASLAESKGLPYMGPLVNMFPDVTKDPMGLHLRAPQYKQLFKQFSKPQSGKNDQGKLIVPMPYSPKEGGDKTVTRVPMPYSPKEGDDKAIRNSIQPMPFSGSAADLLSQFTGAILQAESRGRRYDKSGKLLTSPKGAQGEMQVMPGTITDPGFGVRPARDNSPDEIARVGRDYAAVMLRRYNNNPTLAAVAYNWGPGNADRWIKGGADINKLPAETRNYVVRIAGNMGAPISVPTVAQPSPAPTKRADVRPVPPAKRVSTTTAPRAEAPVEYAPLGSTLDTAPRPAEQQQNVVTRADMERLGPSYQAALAATTLADSRDDEDDYDDEDTIAERYMERRSEQLAQDDSTLEEESTGTSSLADLDLSYQSPFGPEPGTEQPVRLAEGGDPAQEKDMDYKEYVREQLRKETLYAGLGNGDRGSAKRELALFEINKDPRIALMLAGSAGELIRDPVTGAVMGRGVPAVMGRLGIDKNGARAGVSGAAVRLPDGSVKVFPGSADVGYSTPLYKGNLDVSADYALGNLPRPMYGGRIRYEQSFKDGGVVYRADGSPIYGEGIDLSNSGGITEDTRKALATRHSFSPREALSMLGQIGREGVSNLESTLRGSVAAIPGFVGDIESGFRDDKSRKYMTTEEVKRDVLPSRMTAPTAETAGYEELGTYLPLPVTPKQILPTSVVRNLITKARNALPAKEVDTFPMGKLSAEEVLQQLKSFDPKELEKAREAFLASSAEKRRMYHGTLMMPEGKTVVDNRLPGFYKTVGMDQGFTSFKPGTGGMTFVTPNPEFTDLFTGMRFAGKGTASPSRVYPVYVQVKKPFDFENAKHVDELAAEVSAAVRKNKGKKDLAWWMTSGGKPVSTDSVRRLLSTGQWGFIEDPIVLEAAKKLGFDGMYMLEAGTKNLGIFDPKKIKSATGNEGSFNVKTPDIRKAEGGVVHRANGSPVYGEGVDTGPITSDTRKAFANRQSFNSREALAALKRIAGEGVSNFESLARGSVAAVPGIVGDIESFFRDDKKRKFATSTEVERQYLPKRFTEPTKESQGFVEIGTAIDPTIALKAAPKTAKATLKALKESGPQVESTLRKLDPLGATQPMHIIKHEGGNWMPTRERSDVVNDYIDNLIKDSGVRTRLANEQRIVDIRQDSVDHAKSLLENHKDFIKGLYEGRNPNIPPVLKAERSKKISLAQSYKEGFKTRKQSIAEAQQKLDEAQAELARPQSIANFIEKKLQPYIRNNLGTESDQVRLRMDKWELEEQPKLIAEKQKQIDKVRADINRAAAARGNIDPLILTRSQEQLRKLMNEMEGIKSRTGSFFQMAPGERAAMLRRYDMVRSSSPRGEIGTINFPATPTVAKSGLGKIWEETVDFSMDAFKPSEAASEYASIYGKEPPAWLTKAAESGDNKGIYSLDYRSGETLPYQFRHMIDELMSSVDPQTNLPKELRRTPKEIEKMSVDDAAALVDKINGWRAANTTGLDLATANNPAVFEVKTYKTVPNTNIPNERNLRWVEIKMPPEYKNKKQAKEVVDDALKYEGEIMKHCVGTYCPKVEEGTKIFSLRDDAGRPYTTIEAAPDMDVIEEIFKKEFGESSWKRNFKPTSDSGLVEILTQELGQEIPYKIKQIKGVRNGAPIEEVIPFVRDFVSDPQWTDVADINLIGGL